MKEQIETSDKTAADKLSLDEQAAALYHAYIDSTLSPPTTDIDIYNIESEIDKLKSEKSLLSDRLMANYSIRLPQYVGYMDRNKGSIERAESGLIELRKKYAKERRRRIFGKVTRFVGMKYPEAKST